MIPYQEMELEKCPSCGYDTVSASDSASVNVLTGESLFCLRIWCSHCGRDMIVHLPRHDTVGARLVVEQWNFREYDPKDYKDIAQRLLDFIALAQEGTHPNEDCDYRKAECGAYWCFGQELGTILTDARAAGLRVKKHGRKA